MILRIAAHLRATMHREQPYAHYEIVRALHTFIDESAAAEIALTLIVRKGLKELQPNCMGRGAPKPVAIGLGRSWHQNTRKSRRSAHGGAMRKRQCEIF